jgi:hypothetical protein
MGNCKRCGGPPPSNACLDWKYCTCWLHMFFSSHYWLTLRLDVSICKFSFSVLFLVVHQLWYLEQARSGDTRIGHGRGRPNFAWDWENKTQRNGRLSWEHTICDFVPYAHLESPGEKILNHFTEAQQATLSDYLGGLCILPPDLRYRLCSQAWILQQASYSQTIQMVSDFSNYMKILNEVGGSLTIRDFDNRVLSTHQSLGSCREDYGSALYGCVKRGDKGIILKTTAQEAEDYFLDIPPIPAKHRIGTETSPWRRLMWVQCLFLLLML